VCVITHDAQQLERALDVIGREQGFFRERSVMLRSALHLGLGEIGGFVQQQR